MTDVIEYIHRSTLNMTNLNRTHKRKDRSRLYHMVENDLATTVTTKWALALVTISQKNNEMTESASNVLVSIVANFPSDISV